MNRKEHNQRGVEFGIDVTVADAVNRDKDAPSRKYPGCKHHGFNHGIGTNLKYFQIGRGGILMSILHNIDDKLTRKCKRPIILERIWTWYPGKMIMNTTQIGDWWRYG